MTEVQATSLRVRPLQKDDLAVADRIFRVAFGTFLGLPEPEAFMGDATYVGTRYQPDHVESLAAEKDGEFVGSNFVTRWGSFGFFGPLSVQPDLWDAGVGQQLLDRTMDCFEQWGTAHEGLFTFAHSPKHVHLYQKYGFWPRALTAIMSKPVTASADGGDWLTFASCGEPEQQDLLNSCRDLTDSIYPGLDLGSEIDAVRQQNLGDTVIVADGSAVQGFAVCHVGSGTEAGAGTCYVKFAASDASEGREGFERLLSAVESFAAKKDAQVLAAGTNSARHDAYRAMMAHGFRTDLLGVAMQRPNEPGFNTPDAWVMDDWR
jgi:GNAT superfamily N-acetyltransferase